MNNYSRYYAACGAILDALMLAGWALAIMAHIGGR